MRLKSYFAASVEAAMNLAALELGTDAMLVHSRRATPEARHLGEYEVVFAANPNELGSAALQYGNKTPAAHSQKDSDRHPATRIPAYSSGAATTAQVSLDRLSREFGDLKRQVERMAGYLQSAPVFGNASAIFGSSSADVMRTLLEAEVDPQLARELTARAAAQSDTSEVSPMHAALETVLRVDATLGIPDAKQRIAALIGPPGVGKTATLVKLAARFGLTGRRPAQILSMDVFRIAAAEQLRACAAILGIGFQTVGNGISLDQALEEHRGKELILIDTPGFGPADIDESSELAGFFSARTNIDTHLVLPATMRTGDLQRTADRFEAFGASKLIFTRIDETDCFGPIFNLIGRTGKTVSFLSNGQGIPEDLEPATKQKLTALLTGKSGVPKPSPVEKEERRAGECAAAAA